MSNINDRGTIKWTSIMMPEQIKMLNDYWKTTEYKQKPVLDEQELEEIGMKLQMAIHNDLTVEVKYFSDHDYKLIKGKLKKIDAVGNFLQFDDYAKIKLMNVLDVNIE
ncbi:YolD-like family protein [Oceanobacillus sp. Castelsardo]|uniref:YolD-like family protein n=1 Tax=Oceanobacillus sp. Castelsardo TaxID=1851204 RepID=UPI0008392F1F|nr:YolD-like family protein [Oceanobacillus sp. Castelsardo]